MPRLGFDPARPLVATSAMQGCAAGSVFDWRGRGMSEIDVLPLYQAGLVDHPSPPPSQAAPATSPATVRSPGAARVVAGGAFVAAPAAADAEPVRFKAMPGERVTFDPPPPAPVRRGRRS